MQAMPVEQRQRIHAWEQASISVNTRRAIESTYRTFAAWMGKHHPEVVDISETPYPLCLAFVDHMVNERKARQSTVTRVWSVLTKWVVPHLQHQKDEWSAAIKGVKRVLATRGKRPKAAFKLEHLRTAVEQLGDCERSNELCQRKLWLCLAFWTAERRSELRAAKWGDVTEAKEGCIIMIPQSKGDQMGAGQQISIVHRDGTEDEALCACCQLARWRKRCQDAGVYSAESPILRKITQEDEVTDKTMSFHVSSAIVKEAAASAGLDPTKVGCHSTRRGVLQTHADNGVQAHVLIELSRHSGLASIQPYLMQSSQAFSRGF